MKKNVIYLRWAKKMDESYYNFGDDLVPYLVSKLSDNCEIVFIRFTRSRFFSIVEFFKGIILRNYGLNVVKDLFISLKVKKYIISVGSIIQAYSGSRCIVWGSGIIQKNDKIRNSTFVAVRGKYTLNRITELGFDAPHVLGDPALLLPVIFPAKAPKRYRLGIIPHIIHYEVVKRKINAPDVLVVNLNDFDTEKIIRDICSCENTLSSSLHGLIVSHAYGIKSIWFDIEELPLAGDNVKFYDYFSSVNIKEYNPIVFNQLINQDIAYLLNLFNEYKDMNIVDKDILKDIQKKLILSAPFPIRKKFAEIN